MKKRVLSILLVMILAIASAFVPVGAAERGTAHHTEQAFASLSTADKISTMLPTAAGGGAGEEGEALLGDADCDGTVTVFDATAIRRWLVALPSPLDNQKPDNEVLYARAVRDAMTAGEDEIMPLVSITKDDTNVIWDGDRVLMLFC